MNTANLEYGFYLILVLALFGSCQNRKIEPGIKVLKDNWYIQSSEKIDADGQQLSMAYDTKSWYKTHVPSTALAALVKNGEYKDIYFGKNLESIPEERFQSAWWYRTEFDISDPKRYPFASLVFEGLNYSANIWLNGTQIGSTDEIRGTFRQFEFNVSDLLAVGKNYLAVEIVPPKPGDFTIGFVDWNPTPPDHSMGIWREVKLFLNQGVSINQPFVKTELDLDTYKAAKITITADLKNHRSEKISGEIIGRIGDISFKQTYSLDENGTTTITFTPQEYMELIINNPELWWPNNLGNPNLYELMLTATIDGNVSDQQNIRFGIREVEDYINEQGHRGYKINGKIILLRGGGWVDNLLLADDDDKIEAQLKYVKHLNLNTIRLEGFWGSSQKLFNLADEYGILVMPGWSCQWEWEDYLGKKVDEFGGIITEEDMELITRSLEDQVKWLRNHPSIFVWVLGSDMLPRPALEQKYRLMLDKTDPTRPALAACGLYDSEISGPTAVKMNGPYEYVTPNYWYLDKEKGGAHGFNTETGPGPQPPPLESLKKMIPGDKLWPINDFWDYHCGRNEFNTLDRYLNGYQNRYWAAQSVDEFLQLAQVVNYEAMRAMFESFGVNKPTTTGIIQWMLNSAWPELFWQLYDYYLMPNGAFYGAKAGSQPINIAYNYGDKDIYVVNDTHQSLENLKAHIKVLDINSKIIYDKQIPVAVKEYESKKILDLPVFENISSTYFLSLQITGEQKSPVSENFYWLSTKDDVIDHNDDTWFVTRNISYADFSALKTMPKAEVEAEYHFTNTADEQIINTKLENNSENIAFFIELNVYNKATGESILPVFWDNNYVSILPGETKTIQARYAQKEVKEEQIAFRYNGLNLTNAK
jgi:exo-1,4-beta-D-glucosaminidase